MGGQRMTNVFEVVSGFKDTADTAAVDAATAVDTSNQIVVDVQAGWEDTVPSGTPTQVFTTMSEVRDAVLAGYTVTTITSSTLAWVVPTHTEMIAVIVNPGQNGDNASTSTAGAGGLHGSYIAQQLDLTGITSLDVKIGTAGVKNQVRVANGSYTGTLLVEGATFGGVGGIATAFGFTPTASVPGSGGDGTNGTGTVTTTAESGDDSVLATGGAGGAGRGSGGNGNNGSAGGSVSLGAAVKCGGAGGGGGSGAVQNFGANNNGGTGGAGGAPGGGGGGGGGRGAGGAGGTAGSGGAGGAGVIWLFYR